MTIVYINDMYKEEEKVLKDYGIQTKRIEYPCKKEMGFDNRTIFRGPKMNVKQYKEFIQNINIKEQLVTPKQYSIASDAVLYSQCFGDYSPKVLSFDINDPVYLIESSLRSVKLPLFVRSNVESAAKYVGVEACILNDIKELDTVLSPIYKYIKTADRIIMKEVVQLKKINEMTLEYRGIVIDDNLICFDYNSDSGLPNPAQLSWRPIVETASLNGMHGAYFLDLGVDIFNRLFVVECKNLFNGTIRNADRFAKGLKTIC